MGWSKKNGVWQLHREPTCLCAFDADPGNYVRNGSGVSQWNDISSNGHPISQPTASYQPAWAENDATFAGHGSFNFSGPNIRLASTVWSPVVPNVRTDYCVCTLPSVFGDANILCGDAAVDGAMIFATSGVAVGIKGSISIISTPTFAPGSKVVLCAVWDGASSALYVNDMATAAVSGNIGNPTYPGPSSNSLVIGSYYNGAYPWRGKIAAFMRYSSAHTFALRAQIGDRLCDKYGVVKT